MKMMCPHGQTTLGLDLSHYQAVNSWDSLKLSGSCFSFFKCTEGLRTLDGTFARDWVMAPKYGLIRGAYHFFHPSEDPIMQAEHFCSVMGKLEASDLPPVIDWESTDGEAANHNLEMMLLCAKSVQALSGRRPIIYGSPSFLEAVGKSDPRLQAYSLWVAHYGVKCPEVPSPWIVWDFWQFSEAFQVSGLEGNAKCDANYFNGAQSSLQVYAANSAIKIVESVLTENPVQPKIKKVKVNEPLTPKKEKKNVT